MNTGNVIGLCALIAALFLVAGFVIGICATLTDIRRELIDGIKTKGRYNVNKDLRVVGTVEIIKTAASVEEVE